ncbi:hypothetical protein PybrP1_001641 [[Pythium] brassicae (nom. inval.)]|nr:hypothetical protein PybrP1_001641 [[Pythium] brassicae (nom. inval.)]
MGGKAKFQKHTAKELSMKQDQKNKGGGGSGLQTRTVAKLNFVCEICKSASPDIKSYQLHYENKHPKATFDRDAMVQQAEAARAAMLEESAKLVAGSHHKKNGAQVDLVQIPGLVGEYGVTAGHTPIIAQLKPGVIKVHVEREKEVQSFFTPGGFALTHANSVTDIACVELVKIEDIDGVAAEASLNKHKAALATAAEGSSEKIEAQIGVETYQAMLTALAGN